MQSTTDRNIIICCGRACTDSKQRLCHLIEQMSASTGLSICKHPRTGPLPIPQGNYSGFFISAQWVPEFHQIEHSRCKLPQSIASWSEWRVSSSHSPTEFLFGLSLQLLTHFSAYPINVPLFLAAFLYVKIFPDSIYLLGGNHKSQQKKKKILLGRGRYY